MSWIEDGQTVRWLHLSDLHFKTAENYDRDVVLDAFCKSLPSLLKRVGKVDLIFVSGDIAYSGKTSEYANATQFFDELLAQTNLTKSALYIVPGNHDVDRSQGQGLQRSMSSPQDADNYFSQKSPFLHITSRQAAYKIWFDDYFGGIRRFPDQSTFSSPEFVDTCVGKIGILLINSSIFSFDNDDAGKLFIGRKCASDALNLLKSKDTALNISIVHHPLNWLSTVEASNIRHSLRDAIDCILTGHLHENDVEQVVGLSGDVFHLAAGATYQTRDFPNTAMFCSVSPNGLKVTPIRYVDSPRETWSIDTSLYPEEPTFERVYPGILKNVDFNKSNNECHADAAPSLAAATDTHSDDEVLDDLFTTARGNYLYAEPRLMRKSQELMSEESLPEDAVAVTDIVNGSNSFIIETRSEYGATTLTRRLKKEFRSLGWGVIRRDARDLSNYKKKLETELSISTLEAFKNKVLILDNLDVERDEKLIREVYSSGWFDRVLATAVNRNAKPVSTTDALNLPFEFEIIHLWALSRDDIRQFSQAIFDTGDDVFISRIVDKVYGDLLGLCIPLTASNIIMYLKILHREGEFHPLNRVDIVARYLDEALRRPSDAYGLGLNAKGKLDILASFAHRVYTENKTSFSFSYWNEFASSHKSSTLTDFSPNDLLNELVEGKVFVKLRDQYFFRYSFYFTYFLGRHLWSHNDVFLSFINEEEYLTVPGVIDVITGLSSSNRDIIFHLVEKLESRLAEFHERYTKDDFDPLANAVWPDNSNEEEKLWLPVQNAIEAGPKSAQEIDVLKSSVFAERRTADQEVKFAKFSELEVSLFNFQRMLIDALKNGDDVDGPLKLRALEAILQTELAAFQIGTMFARELTKQSYFKWGGIAFIDFHRAVVGIDPSSVEAVIKVVCDLAQVVSEKLADMIGSHRLSAVFAAREMGEGVPFLDVMTFYCLIAAKGSGWQEKARKIIENTDKNAYYLVTILNGLMSNLRHDITLSREREAMKRLVALIHAKRTYGKQAPGKKAVAKMLDSLTERGDFEIDRPGLGS